MAKKYTEEDVMNDLKARIAGSSQAAVARLLGLSITHVNDLLHGRRILSERVVRAMGYTREVTFRKSAA